MQLNSSVLACVAGCLGHAMLSCNCAGMRRAVLGLPCMLELQVMSWMLGSGWYMRCANVNRGVTAATLTCMVSPGSSLLRFLHLTSIDCERPAMGLMHLQAHVAPLSCCSQLSHLCRVAFATTQTASHQLWCWAALSFCIPPFSAHPTLAARPTHPCRHQ